MDSLMEKYFIKRKEDFIIERGMNTNHIIVRDKTKFDDRYYSIIFDCDLDGSHLTIWFNLYMEFKKVFGIPTIRSKSFLKRMILKHIDFNE